MKTFVITLLEAKERQAHITGMMERLGLSFEFFDAIDGRGFKPEEYPHYDALKRRLFFGRDLTGGEIGVLLSHKGIYQKIVDETIPIALIMEDDVAFKDDFPAVLKALEGGAQDFDAARFLGSKKVARGRQYKKRQIHGDFSLNRLLATPGGAHAYVITLAGAKKMLRAMNKNYVPVDTLLGYGWKTGLESFAVQPGLSWQDHEQPQYIGEARFDKSMKLSGWLKFAYPLGRAWFKLSEGLMKRIYYYRNFLVDNFLEHE